MHDDVHTYAVPQVALFAEPLTAAAFLPLSVAAASGSSYLLYLRTHTYRQAEAATATITSNHPMAATAAISLRSGLYRGVYVYARKKRVNNVPE